MKRSEPSKDPLERIEINLYKKRKYRIGSFSDDQNDSEEIEIAQTKEMDENESDIDEIVSSLGDLQTIFDNLHDYFYNGDRSLKTPPIVTLNQLYSYQYPHLNEELNILKKTSLNEIYIPIGANDLIAIIHKIEYINHLRMYDSDDHKELVEQLIDYILKSDGSCLLPPKLFTQEEFLILLRKGLVYEKKFAQSSRKEYYILYPRYNVYMKERTNWIKKILKTIDSAPFHTISKTVCFLS